MPRSFGVRATVVPLLAALLAVACKDASSGESPGVSPGLDASVGAGGDGAAADGSTVAATSLAVSGTRLKIVAERVGDVALPDRLRDALRNEHCSPQSAADGSFRCLPYSFHELLYSDATCTTRVAAKEPTLACPSDDTTVHQTANEFIAGGTPCAEGRTRVFPVGAPIATPSAVYRRDMTGACVGGGPDSRAFAAVGAELPPETFVKLAYADVPAGAVAARYLTSEDGLRRLEGARDVARAVDCAPAAMAGGTRCVPTATATTSIYFGDGKCTTALFVSPLGCPAPSIGRTSAPNPADACSALTSVFSVGAKWTQSSFTANGSCSAGGTPSDDLYAIGAPILADQFPALERELVGTGPARSEIWTSGGAAVSRASSFATPAGKACFSLRFADGKRRCGPPTHLFVDALATYFADAACSEPLAGATEPCSLTADVIMRQNAGDCGSGGLTAYQRGAAFTGTAYSKLTGSCAPANVVPAPSFFRIGAAIPPETFPEVTKVEL